MTMPEPTFSEDAWSFMATWSEGGVKALVTGSKLSGQLFLLMSDRQAGAAPWTSAVLSDPTGQAMVSLGHFQLWLLAELEALHG